MRYARNLGLDVLGQTGKFHTSWGDFHSFKSVAALQFECFRMIAMGAKCSIGDQLPPRGRLDTHVYDLIGKVYAEVEAKEPWCVGAKAVSEVAVMTPEEFTSASASRLPSAIKGATRMLEEAAQQFEIVDSQSDLKPFAVLILPDIIPVDQALAAKLQAYVAGGGKVIATFESGLAPGGQAFAGSLFGVEVASEGPRDAGGNLVRGEFFPRGDYVDYLLPKGDIGQGLPPTEHVMYIRGMDVRAHAGAEVLASIYPSYFDRTWEHFCSHRQTPSAGAAGNPGIVRNGDVIYFSSPLFTLYDRMAPPWCKRLLLNALEMFLPQPLVRHSGPSTLFVTLAEQNVNSASQGTQAGAGVHLSAGDSPQRFVLHLLHYIPERRGTEFDVIEDVIPLYNVPISLRTARPVGSVTVAQGGAPLPFDLDGDRVLFTVPEVVGHQMITINFA
jgi:hypothetical protein